MSVKDRPKAIEVDPERSAVESDRCVLQIIFSFFTYQFLACTFAAGMEKILPPVFEFYVVVIKPASVGILVTYNVDMLVSRQDWSKFWHALSASEVYLNTVLNHNRKLT